MGICLNEKASYFSKSPSCCVPPFHSLGNYFPQGSLVLFSEQISVQEPGMDSCHERVYTGWSCRDEVLLVNVCKPSLRCCSFFEEPIIVAVQERKGVFFFQPSPSGGGYIVWACFGMCALLPSTDSPGSWSPNTPDSGIEQIFLLALCKNRSSFQVPHTYFCVFSSSHTHQLIPSFQGAIYFHIAPELLGFISW